MGSVPFRQGTPPATGIARDAGGYPVFSAGEAGAAHVTAHRMLDRGRYRAGRRLLGRWLDGRRGRGSEWLHLQWHMAVFEIELGDWDAARDRYLEHIAPVAATTQDALTDAPSLLWRLALCAPRAVELPWAPLRATAGAALRRPRHPYVALHLLLALAGAGDVAGLDRWLVARATRARSRAETIVVGVVRGLRDYAAGDYLAAGVALTEHVTELHHVGGSRAQNELFVRIMQHAWARAVTDAAPARVA